MSLEFWIRASLGPHGYNCQQLRDAAILQVDEFFISCNLVEVFEMLAANYSLVLTCRLRFLFSRPLVIFLLQPNAEPLSLFAMQESVLFCLPLFTPDPSFPVFSLVGRKAVVEKLQDCGLSFVWEVDFRCC